nr:hypothetical protein [Tanacetum cinerariifolium]
MHKAFPLPGESSHWQYKFPLPVESVPTARRMEIPLPGVCTAMMKKLPVKEKWQKVPVVNYEIVMINNKPRYKIIRADDTHQLYTSFITLLKNFDREYLEDLWRIVKARFSTSKPTNFSDDYLLSTLKTMFEKTDGQDGLRRNQQTVYEISTFQVHSGAVDECGKIESGRRESDVVRATQIYKTATLRISTRMMVEHVLYEA